MAVPFRVEVEAVTRVAAWVVTVGASALGVKGVLAERPDVRHRITAEKRILVDVFLCSFMFVLSRLFNNLAGGTCKQKP